MKRMSRRDPAGTPLVSFTILDDKEKVIESATSHEFVGINVDKSGNVFFLLGTKNNHIYVTFQIKDVDAVISAFQSVLQITDRVQIVLSKELDWVVFFYPGKTDIENEIWLCEFNHVKRNGNNVDVVFDWLHHGAEKAAVMPAIEKFSRSDAVEELSRSLQMAAEVYRKNPECGIKEALAQLTDRFEQRIDISNFTIDKIELAKKAGGFSEFGKYILKEHAVPYKIVMSFDERDVPDIVRKLISIRDHVKKEST